MPIVAGTKLGPYEILAPIGAGGMGEVYRAKDMRLDRTVAIKVLPSHLSSNPDLRQRFEREARTVSSLNHPHICTLHDIGHQDGIDYLVMEFLEGDTLGQRLSKGPLPTDQVLRYAIEIADALDKAHKQGIVHRDLKPGNIMLTRSGAKLLDFGLAKFQEAAPQTPMSDVSALATEQKQNLTAEGSIIGTTQYMAPEQLEGKEADSRTDIFAFGLVLYEMITGKKAFTGKSPASLIAAILEKEPEPISATQPMTPPALDRAVKLCLAKESDERWQNAHDLMNELKWIREGRSQAGVAAPVATRRKTRERLAWVLVAALGLALTITAGTFLYPRGARPETVRLAMTSPGVTVTPGAGNVSISPDGHMIVFVGSDSAGQGGLWLRSLAETAPHNLVKTAGATYPFWSPDSKHIAFFADGKLKQVSVAGGDVDIICTAPDGRGGTRSSRGVIVFAPTVASPLMRVDAAGGEPVPATKLDSTNGEVTHRFPTFLPDGEHFLFMAGPSAEHTGNSIYVGSLQSTGRTPLLKTARMPVYAEPGYLIYSIGDRIAAQRFNPKTMRVEGQPLKLPDGIPNSVNTGDRVASASANGTLVIAAAESAEKKLAWFNRRGEIESTIPLPPGIIQGCRISPDGTRIITMIGPAQGNQDLWVIDLKRGSSTRLTFGPYSSQGAVWSPDGKSLVFQSNRNGPFDLFVKQANGSGGDTLLFSSPTEWKEPFSWSPDGRTIAFLSIEKETNGDILLVSADGKGKVTPYLKTPAAEWYPNISPDGRWLAYSSNESGRVEIYVQSFPTPGTKYQATTTGGTAPQWTNGGRELFYLTTEGSIASVPVTLGESLEFGTSQTLFSLPGNAFDVSPDGQHVLALVPVDSAAAQWPTVVLNWAAALNR
jgi:Tol biopolymer transport system component/tRNA A-37 threonylcarbamoyl transferase component Bud32